MRWNPFNFKFPNRQARSNYGYDPTFTESLENTWDVLWGGLFADYYSFPYSKLEFTERLGIIDYLTLGTTLFLLALGKGLEQTNIPLINLVGSLIVAIAAGARLLLTAALEIAAFPLLSFVHFVFLPLTKDNERKFDSQARRERDHSDRYSNASPPSAPSSYPSYEKSTATDPYEAREKAREIERENARQIEREQEQRVLRIKRATEIAEEGKDLLATLGISREKYNEDPGIAKKAYRKLVLIFHPDKVKERALIKDQPFNETDANDKWKLIVEAQEILSDKEQAKAYLRYYQPQRFFRHPPEPTPSTNTKKASKHSFKNLFSRKK